MDVQVKEWEESYNQSYIRAKAFWYMGKVDKMASSYGWDRWRGDMENMYLLIMRMRKIKNDPDLEFSWDFFQVKNEEGVWVPKIVTSIDDFQQSEEDPRVAEIFSLPK